MKKSESNRMNAKASTGPRTRDGLSKSSKNALKHGLTSKKDILLSSESQEEYDHLLEAMVRDLKPGDGVERLLVERATQFAWRLIRINGIETRLFENGQIDAENDPLFITSGPLSRPYINVADVFRELDRTKVISNLTKYEAHCERGMYRALNDLERRQAARMGRPSAAEPSVDIRLSAGLPGDP